LLINDTNFKLKFLMINCKPLSVFCSDVNKDWTCKDKDKDLIHKDQDKDKDLNLVLKESLKDKDKDKDKDFTYSYLLQVAAKPTIAIKQQQ